MKGSTETGDFCICVKCEIRIPHKRGNPCRGTLCPNCGKTMMKQGSYHHQLYEQKKILGNSEGNET